MNIPISTTIDKFFIITTKILNPVLKLSNMELNVLSCLLLLAYANRDKKKELLESELLSYKSRVAVRSKLDISEASLNNNISTLKKKGLLIKTNYGFKLSKNIETMFPIGNKLNINFNITL